MLSWLLSSLCFRFQFVLVLCIFTLICRLFFFLFSGCRSVFSTGADVCCTGILVSLLFPDYWPISLVLFFLCDFFPLLFASLSAYLLSCLGTAYPASFSFSFSFCKFLSTSQEVVPLQGWFNEVALFSWYVVFSRVYCHFSIYQ